jgi:hypothetical protein
VRGTHKSNIKTDKILARFGAIAFLPGRSLQDGFGSEGEQHYWVHVTIDRFTGQVLDKQIEVVNE